MKFLGGHIFLNERRAQLMAQLVNGKYLSGRLDETNDQMVVSYIYFLKCVVSLSVFHTNNF